MTGVATPAAQRRSRGGTAQPDAPVRSRARIALALAAVYVVWGSTYLAIAYAIRTLPPFLMAGARFVVAGGILYAWSRARGDTAPARGAWRAAFIAGGLLLLGGNGGVVWAEQVVPSGIAALLVATLPIWMVLLDWALPGGRRPSLAIALGLALGFAGIVLLVGPEQFARGGRVHPVGAAVLVLASLSWAAGSLFNQRRPIRASPLLGTGMQMIGGGVLLLLLGSATGEWGRFDPAVVSNESILALLYLITFGSLIGFTAYIYLLRVTTPAVVSTYAYVNPVVAVFLGWAIASEPVTPRTLLAAGVILSAVALITARRATASGR